MEQNTSWQSDSHSASQVIPFLSWSPKIYYRVHKSPSVNKPLIPTLSFYNDDDDDDDDNNNNNNNNNNDG
jgi:hypothetical protein